MTFEWEKISGSSPSNCGGAGFVTYRAWVPGGWIIRTVTWVDDNEAGNVQSESSVFVPDLGHSWGRDTTMDGVI